MNKEIITKKAYCGICLAGCGVEVDIQDGKVVDVRRDPDHMLSKGFLCVKGRKYGVGEDKLRVTSPYMKVNNSWHKITWAEAYQKISERLKTVIKENGKQSVAAFYGAGDPLSSMNPTTVNGFINALGSTRLYNVLSLEFTNMFYVFEKMYGKQYRTSQPDLANTQYLLILGHNPLVSLDHPDIVKDLHNFKKRGAKIVVVDPRFTETARIADMHIPIKPGMDLYFLQAMYHCIFSENLQDTRFLAKHTKNSDFFTPEHFMSPEEASGLCGIDAETIKQVARDFANAETANAIAKMGITSSKNSTITYWLMETLNTVTGNIDKPGGLIFNPGVINLDFALWLSNLGKRPRSTIGNYPCINGGRPASELPREILSDQDPVKALIVSCGNPALVFPNSGRTVEALKNLDLLISIDVYMNETAQLADFFLPAATYYERDDFYITFPNHQPFPFGQWMPALVEPEGDAKPQWLIFRELSKIMKVPILNKPEMELMFKLGKLAGSMIGKPEAFVFTPKNYYRVLTRLLGPIKMSKIKMSELIDQPQGVKADAMRFGEALKRIGKIDAAPDEFVQAFKQAETPVISTDKFPFTLITGERHMHQKSSSLRGIDALTDKRHENHLRIHPEDAGPLGIDENQMVEVRTKTGAVKIKPMFDDTIRKGVVSMSHGWGRQIMHPEKDGLELQGANANELTDDMELDPVVGIATYNAIPCSIHAEP